MSLVTYDTTYDVTYGPLSVVWGGPSEVISETGETDAASYARSLAALLPQGQAWPTDPASTLQRVLLGLAQEMQRVDARAAALVQESDPRTTTELLSDWERSHGLPDPCVEVAQTVAERRQALMGRILSIGGQSRQFFISLAAALGYSITITEFPTEAAAISAGIPYTGTSWANTWLVNVPVTVAVRDFRAGAGSAGEPLRSWGNDVLECQFQRLKPAHTSVLFAYA